MKELTIIEAINKIRKGETSELSNDTLSFIKKCFKYNVFLKKPTKEHK